VPTTAATILVVDDHELNLALLQELLEPEGHQLELCKSGEDALRCLAQSTIDLVLLDITMPGIDGLEVCRRIRENPSTASIPVIMVTALAHRQQQLDGIAAGATDYLTKPIDGANLLLRVRNALEMRRLHTQVAAQLTKLQAMEQLRDSLVHMLVHDLRAPLQAIAFGIEFARDRARELQEDQLLEDIDHVGASATLLSEMVSNVLDVSRFEEGAMPLQLAECDLGEIATEAIDSVTGRARGSRIQFSRGENLMVLADRDVVRRVIANLVANACKFSPADSFISVQVQQASSQIECRVVDAGPGISPEHHDRIFDKFGQVAVDHGGLPSSGLGLTFCKLGIEAHDGSIGVESELGSGATFWFSLPCAGDRQGRLADVPEGALV
jgi:K+-sensing histidine kinase KdpD